MLNLSTIAKMLGVNISPEDIAKVEAIIPQIPGRAVEVINTVNAAVVNYHERMVTLEKAHQQMGEKLDRILEVISNDAKRTPGPRLINGAHSDGDFTTAAGNASAD